MTSIIKNQIVKQLARFTKNLSPSKISLKFLKGEGELRNLELNEKFLTDLLELPPFIRLTRAVCNKISAKIHWTRLKTDPIRLFLDCVEVDMEMIENVSEDFHSNQPMLATNPTTREKPSEYGFAEKVVDGMHVTINSVVMAFKTPTFRATFQMSHLSVHSTDPSWEKASLRNTRIKDEVGKEVLTFKQITFGTLRIDADALYKSGQEDSSPLRLITSAAKVNIVIKKKIEDCSVVAARLHVICDDILWVLTHAQLQAVASFAKSVVQVVEKCKKSEPAPSVASDDSSHSSNSPTDNWSEHIPTKDNSNPTPSSLFQKEDVKETSYRVTTAKIDIHLCDDTPIEKSFMDGGGQSGGSMQIVVNRLSFEHYPYHLAFTSRVEWASHNEASLTRAHWVQELFNSFKKSMKDDGRKSRRKPQMPDQGNSRFARPSQDSGLNRNVVMATDGPPKKPSRVYLYECAFVISCDEFIVMPVTTNDMSSTSSIPFLCCDKKSLYLPTDMPTLQFDYTLYFYPGIEDAKVPQPNLFCQINPLHLTMDNVTCIWFHRFMLSIRLGFAWAEEIITAQETEPRHIDVRIEGLMPKLTLPLPSDPGQAVNSHYKQYRPQALQVQISSFRVSNTRVGLEFKQSDLVNTLEEFLKSQLYSNSEVYPNDGNDVKPLPQMAWLNDFSLCAGISNIENIREEDIMGGEHSVVWMLNARQCWCEFVGIEETNGRPRPFIEPFPLNLCMCYPIAGVNQRPAHLSLHEGNMASNHSQNSTATPLTRSPSDPYCKQSRPYRKSSSTKSTPLSSPGFAKIHKSRSAASVNIPVLSSDRRDNTMSGLSPNVSESGSEESMSSYTGDSVTSGSIYSLSSNIVGNDKVATNSNGNNQLGNNTTLTENSRESSVYRPTAFVNSTSGIESDGSGDSSLDKDSPRSKLSDNGQDKSECSLSILLNIPSSLAIKLDHYQFVFLMRLQEGFVTLRDVLFADLEKFDVQRRKMLGKDSDEVGVNDPGILVSLVSKGAEVVLLVPAPTGDQSQSQDQNCAAMHSHDPSPNETLEMTEVEDDLKAMKDYHFSPRDNEKLLETNNDDEHLNEVAEDTVVIENDAHRRSGSESSSINTSTFGSDYSLLTAGTGSERSYEGRDTSTVTITGTSLECSVAMKKDDFAFKLLARGCELSEGHHENLEVYLNQKSKLPKESNAVSKGCGELRLRYAMGSTIDETMKGASENGVANLTLSDVLVPLLMSNVDGLLECVQDEVEAPLPYMPVVIDIKNLRLNIISDAPPRLLSLPPSLPLNVHIEQATIIRSGDGEVQVNVPKGHRTQQQNLHRTHEGHLITSDDMIERLREETNEMTTRVTSIRSENVCLLNKLQVANEVKESLESERNRLLVTVERLTEELVKSNREYDKMQEVFRHLQKSDQ